MNTQATVRRSSSVGVPPKSRGEFNRPVDRFRHNLVRWQSGISLAVVLAILVGLVAIVYQTRSVGDSGFSDQPALAEIFFEENNPIQIILRSNQCVPNGVGMSDEQLLQRSTVDWRAPEYAIVKVTNRDTAMKILQTRANSLLCGVTSDYQATPGVVDSGLTEITNSYYSDRFLLYLLFEQLPSEEQAKATEFYCNPPREQIGSSFPLTLNWPTYQIRWPSVEGHPPSSNQNGFGFDPSQVFLLSDGRYGVIICSLSSQEYLDPEKRDGVMTFVAFREQNGRFYIDEMVDIFQPVNAVWDMGTMCA